MRSPAPLVALLALLAGTAARGQQPSLSVGAVTARAGELRSGFLDVPPGVDAATRIPITVVRGSRPGPTL
ncbi:MAG: M14 family metallopeptidase, partial [Gemmatimonadales bacterium]